MKYMSYVLQLYNKDWDNIVCLIFDNCNTKKATANLVEKPVIVCAIHRFNLAAQLLYDDEEELLQKVNRIMSKLKFGCPCM